MKAFTESESLSITDKWKIYCLYLVRYFSLKQMHIVSLTHINDVTSFHKATSSYKKFELKLDSRIVDLTRSTCRTFDEFISDRKIITDNGEDWERQGYAQRIRIDFPIDSLTYWIIRHKDFCK